MDYFDDLNPYLVRQENETPPTPNPGTPPVNPGAIGQVYLGNIIKLNTGKLGTFYFTFSGYFWWSLGFRIFICSYFHAFANGFGMGGDGLYFYCGDYSCLDFTYTT